jgi:hypothetical protein
MRMKKRIIPAIFLIISLVFMPWSTALGAYDTDKEEASAESMMGDAIAARPLGLIATVVGSALFVVSLPFSALGGNVDEAAQKMVVAPAKFTFKRPLGEF